MKPSINAIGGNKKAVSKGLSWNIFAITEKNPVPAANPIATTREFKKALRITAPKVSG